MSCRFVFVLTLSSLLTWLQTTHGQQQQLQSSTCLEPYCFCTDTFTLRCSNFTRFDQLDFKLTNNRIFKSVELRPLVPQLELNERLTFHGLRMNGRLSISNIASFNAFYNPFRQIVYDRLDISFFNSHFTFVGAVGSSGNQNAEQLIIDKCELTPAALNFDYVFSDLNVNEFVMCNIYFPKTLCPILFRNSNIKNMIINDPIGAYGFSSLATPTNDPIYVLNTNINQIDFTYSPENVIQPQWLDADSIINPELFIRTDRININSARRLAYIKEDTFQKLPGLRKFELNNVPLKDLLGYNRQWLKHLNYHMVPFDLEYTSLNQSMSGNVFQLLIWTNDDWNFNDEKDICLFRDFPHHRLVFPFLLFSKTTLPCTCTIYWLYKYFNRYQHLYNLNQDVVPLHCFKNSYWDRCHFDSLFQKYCPKGKPDPDETYTTLKPSIDHVPSTICCTSSTATPTYPTYSSTGTIYTTSPTIYPSTTTSPYLTSSSSYLLDFSKCSFSTAAFFLAIGLSIVAAFIIAALIILYYKVYRKQEEEGEEEEYDEDGEQDVTQPNEIEINFDGEIERSESKKARKHSTKRPHGRFNRSNRPSFILPRQLIVADLVVDTSFICVCDRSSGGARSLACNGTCADCNAPVYI